MAVGRGIRAIAINGASSTGATVIETLVRAAYFIAITRLVGPEGYGLWTYAIALYGLVLSFSALGFETIVPNNYGNDTAKGDRQAGMALAMRVMMAGIGTVLLAIYALALVPQADQKLAVFLAAPALFLRGTSLLNRVIFVGRQEVARNVPNVLIGRLTELTLGIAIIAGGGGIMLLLALHAVCWGLELLLSWRLLRRSTPVRFTMPTRDEAEGIFRKSAPIAVLDLTFGFMMSAAIVLYEPYVSGFSTLGQIGVAMQMAAFLLTAGFAFLATAAPVLARSLENGDPRLPYYGWIIAASAALGTAAALGIFSVVAEPLFNFVLGDGYIPAIELTLITMLSAGMVILPHGFQQLLILQGKYRGLIAANLAACAVTIAIFVFQGAHLTPSEALIAVFLGWLARAAIIMARGTFHGQHLAKSLKPGS